MLFPYLFHRIPVLLLAFVLGLTSLMLPSVAAARVPTQVEIAEADALLSSIEECTKDSLAGQDKWHCVEMKYHELLRMRLADVNPIAHWAAAHASWARGDITTTYDRLNLIVVEFPDYQNDKFGSAFTSVKDWLTHIDANYAPVKLRQPVFRPSKDLKDQSGNVATKFANAQLSGTRHFEGYLPHGEYTFGAQTFVVTAEGITEKVAEPTPADAVTGPGKLVILHPGKTPQTFPSRHKLEWKPEDYTVLRWTTEADCLAKGSNFLWAYDLREVTVDQPIKADLEPGTYWMATYLRFDFRDLVRQDACQEVIVNAGSETIFTPQITSTPAMVERQLHPPTQDYLDGMVLVGPGFRFDSPTHSVAGLSAVLEGRMVPSWWLNADPGWTLGYQVFLDYRQFAGSPTFSWGAGGTVGRDWNLPAKASSVTVSIDGGVMLGTGVFGAPCSLNPAATNLGDVDMNCGEGGLFPRLVPASYMELPGSFYGFYGGLTGRAMIRWNVKNSGWFLGGGAWGTGQVFMAPGNQMNHQADVIFTDGTSMEVPFQWDNSLFLRGQLVPGIVVGGRFP